MMITDFYIKFENDLYLWHHEMSFTVYQAIWLSGTLQELVILDVFYKRQCQFKTAQWRIVPIQYRLAALPGV